MKTGSSSKPARIMGQALLAMLVVVGLVVAAKAPPPGPAHAGIDTSASPGWQAVSASGRVEARSTEPAQEAWFAVARGDRFAPTTVVRTGRNGGSP